MYLVIDYDSDMNSKRRDTEKALRAGIITVTVKVSARFSCHKAIL
jgi:hypothetical protein